MGLGAGTTADEVLAGTELTGTVALVTGASTGLGKETARALAVSGARVLLAVRDAAKGEATLAELGAAHPGLDLEYGLLELDDLVSVRAFADWVGTRTDRLTLLVNNAGVMATPLGRTAQGFERQFGTNHLGHFLLTLRLLPLLRAGAPSRVVNLSSGGHQSSGIRWDDPNFEHTDYDPWIAYGQSKTANILFSLELDRREAPHVRSLAVHPGRVGTELGRYLTKETVGALMQRASGALPPVKTIPEGAATSVWACVSDEPFEAGAVYLADCAPAQAAAWATDADAARRLWELSARSVGEPVD